MALKVLHPHLAAAGKSILRFQQEAKAAALLDHPGIVRVHQLAFDADMPFIVMDYVRGKSLTQILRTQGALGLERTLSIMIKVADALEHAHKHGVVHRDLKPSNILVCGDGDDEIKVVDFGIAKILPSGSSSEHTPTLTSTGELFGTPAYMSPEQLHERKIDGRADQYAFGCVMYECLTAAPPFTGTSLVELMMKQVRDTPLSLREASMGTRFPDWLEQVVARMLSKQADDRFTDMTQVRLALLDAGRSRTQKAPVGSPRSPFRWRLIVAITLAVMAACACAAYFSFKITEYPGRRQANRSDSVEGPVTEAGLRRGPVPDYESKEARQEKVLANGQLAAHVLALSARGLTKVRRAPSVISDEGLVCLKSMAGLTSMNLNRCINITGNGMKLLAAIVKEKHFDLQEIALAETFINDDGLRAIAEISTLRSVMISGMTDITDSGVIAVTLLPDLNRLSIEGDEQLTMTSLRAIGRARNLSWLNLSSCNWGRGMQYLSGLNLRYLDVRNCNLFDEDIAEIAKIATLEELDVSDNKMLSERSLTELMKLKNIQRLRLSANAIDSDRILAFLKHMGSKKVSFRNK